MEELVNIYNVYGNGTPLAFWLLIKLKTKSMGKKHALLLLLFLVLLLLLHPGNCRYISPNNNQSSTSKGLLLVSNGGGQGEGEVARRRRPSSSSYSSACKQTHGGGVMPCTTTVLGNVFLILVYGYLMFLSAKLLYQGSEILVELFSPGMTGGVFLPLLSALPDAIIILGKLTS